MKEPTVCKVEYTGRTIEHTKFYVQTFSAMFTNHWQLFESLQSAGFDVAPINYEDRDDESLYDRFNNVLKAGANGTALSGIIIAGNFSLSFQIWLRQRGAQFGIPVYFSSYSLDGISKRVCDIWSENLDKESARISKRLEETNLIYLFVDNNDEGFGIKLSQTKPEQVVLDLTKQTWSFLGSTNNLTGQDEVFFIGDSDQFNCSIRWDEPCCGMVGIFDMKNISHLQNMCDIDYQIG